MGLASAVLIDATIVRAVLLPANMKPLGDRNRGSNGSRKSPQSPPCITSPELYPSRLSVDVEREDARVSLALRGELDETLETSANPPGVGGGGRLATSPRDIYPGGGN